MEKLGERVSSFIRVLWITTTEKRAEKLAGMMEGNLCWVTYEEAYLGKPEIVLAPIWYTGKTGDQDLHSLLESRRDRGEE
jgi:hypothetical protein